MTGTVSMELVLSWGIAQGLWAIASIVLVEIVRDVYHVTSHYWAPLKALHNWHHKAYKRDFTPVSPQLYAKAQLYNDVPESLVMMASVAAIALLTPYSGFWLGFAYAAGHLMTAIARSQRWLLVSDLTHEPGALTQPPSNWLVNRTYHWRHHFDETTAYYGGSLTLIDKILGTAVSLKGKTVAITGASGTMGRSLIAALAKQGAKPIALTTSAAAQFDPAVTVIPWQPGNEAELKAKLNRVDILVINHGINVHGERTSAAIARSLEVNSLSALRLIDMFTETVETSAQKAIKEIWVNTSEAEVNPAFSPLYETSKRLLGDLVTLRRLDAPCVIRKVVLGPFKSNLNPVGVMSADWVAWAVVALAKRNVRNIIVTINPLTYLFFPIKEFSQSLYFRLFSKA
ncbi:MAG: bifunctional sterol desaturase/short chain dehydrogenase [Cyanobacteria bacterium P01_A01_bin.123]